MTTGWLCAEEFVENAELDGCVTEEALQIDGSVRDVYVADEQVQNNYESAAEYYVAEEQVQNMYESAAEYYVPEQPVQEAYDNWE